MPCCEINDCAQMSKTIIAVRHFGLGGRESLETAVTNVDPLSEYIVLGRPRRAISRFKHGRNVVVSRLLISSKCIAFERLHEKIIK